MTQGAGGVLGLLGRLGGRVRRRPPAGAAGAPARNAWHWLRRTLSVGTVLDVGANNGDFAAFLYRLFRPERLLLFEPQAALAEGLRRRFAGRPGVTVFEVALGRDPGPATFYHNAHGPSSSLLPVSARGAELFPQAARAEPGPVAVARLDDVVDAAALPGDACVKMDVQGAEDLVLDGGRRVFARARCVYVEVSFVPAYRGQPLFEEVHARLAGLGYRLAGVKNQEQAGSGQPLFAHAFYLRDPGPAPRAA